MNRGYGDKDNLNESNGQIKLNNQNNLIQTPNRKRSNGPTNAEYGAMVRKRQSQDFMNKKKKKLNRSL